MRKATVAKLSLTAAVGLGALLGQAGFANAETPPKQLDQTGDIVFVPAPPTTIKPIDPNPQFNPELPLQQPNGGGDPDPCPQISCDLELPQDGDPEPECNPIALCDEITSDPGCQWTHGCPEEPECPEIQASCDLTSDGGGDEGTDGGDEGTDDGGESTTGGDEGTTGGDEGTTGGDESTTGGSGGSLPKTGAEMATWAIAGLGLTGVGAALRKLGKRA